MRLINFGSSFVDRDIYTHGLKWIYRHYLLLAIWHCVVLSSLFENWWASWKLYEIPSAYSIQSKSAPFLQSSNTMMFYKLFFNKIHRNDSKNIKRMLLNVQLNWILHVFSTCSRFFLKIFLTPINKNSSWFWWT